MICDTNLKYLESFPSLSVPYSGRCDTCYKTKNSQKRNKAWYDPCFLLLLLFAGKEDLMFDFAKGLDVPVVLDVQDLLYLCT